ncbi:MAG TPA: T9SS type A sorting domain-containing protein [Candidatus Acidoferrales bacterium]|nr:T9SS type A sorting domain-containing protein [Candidatus Acidoferrales bacterium]
MKTILKLFVLITVAMLLLPRSTMSATVPDTVRVWANPSTWPAGSLNDVVNSDTVAGGYVKPNTVFLLQQTGTLDSVYYVTAPISAKGSVTIIGKINPKSGHPPVIAPYINTDNSSIGDYFEPQGNDTLTLKGLYFIGTRPDGASNTGRFVNPTGDHNTFIFDHCILENITGPQHTPNLFDTWAHAHCSFYITNCEFRNNQDDAVGNPGFAWIEVSDSAGVPCDTAYFHNNTFFFNGGLVLGGGGFTCYKLDFQHNTIFMSTQQGVFELYQLTNAVITNNVFYSVGSASQPTSWGWNPGSWFTGAIVLDTLSATLKGPAFNLTEADRHITITNNAYYWPTEIQNAWTTLSLSTQQLIGARPGMLTDKTTWPHINVSDNDSTDPGFNATLLSQSITNMLTLVDTAYGGTASGTAGGYRPYVYPLALPTDTIKWTNVAPNWAATQGYPVPENLRYSNTTFQTAGTDGKALGDLNWFPEQLIGVHQTSNVIPSEFNLSQNYPNPFNPSTNIKVSLSHAGVMSLTIYNVLGQVVQVVDQGRKVAGEYTYNVNLDRFASGVYFYTLREETNSITKKMLLLK